MTRYEIGTRVAADALRVGDLFGEELITAIRPHYDSDRADYLEGFTVVFADRTRLYADPGEFVCAPNHHAVEVTVDEAGLAVSFTCLAQGASQCRRVCGRCGSARACQCQASPADGGCCRAADRFNAMPADAVLRAYDGPAVPLCSGPVTVRATADGYRWRYPTTGDRPVPAPTI
ncbi:hypothetical protein ACFXHA_45515 [Nocardia sp. NPDC059240]|uniref:hypothetical protein n=1 Tax=Nocardia sp. NPDC059240 TaxID=3346786 RepID=UPI0036922E28